LVRAVIALAVTACVATTGWTAVPAGQDARPATEAATLLLASNDAGLVLAAGTAGQPDSQPGKDPEASLLSWQAGLALLLMLSAMALGAHYRRRYRALHAEVETCRATEVGMRRSEQSYRALVEAVPFPVIISCARTGRVRFLNERGAEHFGVSRDQVMGRPIAEFCQDPVIRGELHRRIVEEGRVNDVEMYLHDVHGQPFWGLVSASQVEFEGRPAMFIAVNNITERKRLEARLEHLVNTDALTGLASRRRILEQLELEFGRATRYASPLTLLAVDLDHFKRINDTYGHAAGDEALRAFSAVLRSGLRNPDCAGRLGGEEFMVVLPETGQEEAHQVAERLRAAVEDLVVCLEKQIIRLTVSIGIASRDSCGSVEELMKAADHALYAAKDAGRNRIAFQACKLH
jgi:diguanylate cyclase (GGDEF)-like protein/PAS domain S-box-containing protein